MEQDISALLKSIKPTHKYNVMDSVAQADIDVSSWGLRKDGQPVTNPNENPKYCYEWAFGGNNDPIALCVWHESLIPSEGQIVYEDSLRELALQLYRVAMDRAKPKKVRSRARSQEKRAQKFDSAVQQAYRKSLPIRVILLTGAQRARAEIGWETAQVKFRALDDVPWYAHTYEDNDGTFRLVRGIPKLGEVNENLDSPSPTYEDQFSIPDSEKRETTGRVFVRSPEARHTVLKRAKGYCEFCGEPGFKTVTNGVYLETHHVIPLSQNGPDTVWNLVALCPNDHRRAHHGDDRVEIRNQLIEKLLALYPPSKEFFDSVKPKESLLA